MSARTFYRVRVDEREIVVGDPGVAERYSRAGRRVTAHTEGSA